ncbi:MAG: adenine deaminase C-terminal domain-containing protein, partial [Chitinophagaceae bacterium]
QHYKLDTGLLRKGDFADFIVTNDLIDFKVAETWINGLKVAANGISYIRKSANEADTNQSVNQFNCDPKEKADFMIDACHEASYTKPIIEAFDGQLITGKYEGQPIKENGCWVSDTNSDILKIAVVNRYRNAPVTMAFIRNVGLKQGALASSVAHDSHNIVAVGVDDESLCKAVNMIIAHEGGVSCVNDNLEMILPLPVGGLMSTDDGYKVAELYTLIDRAAKDAGSTLSAPFMTLSFMALLVIPHLKLSDKGLFDGDTFQLI